MCESGRGVAWGGGAEGKVEGDSNAGRWEVGCFGSFRFVLFCVVSVRFISFRFVSCRFFSACFVLFCFVLFILKNGILWSQHMISSYDNIIC